MGVFDRQIASAKRMIAKYGEFCVFKQPGDPIPLDPEKPWIIPDGAEVDFIDIKIAFFGLDVEKFKMYQEMFGTEVPTGIYMGYMANVPFTPTLKDSIRRKSGAMLSIVNINVVNPNGEAAILYEIMVRE